MFDERAELVGHGPADGVGYVDRRRPGLHGGLADLHEKIRLRARGVFGREFHVVHESLRALHAFHCEAEDFVLRLVELVFAMNFRRGEKNVNAPAPASGFDGGAGGVDVLGHAPCKAGDNASVDFASDGADGLEVPLADDGEAGLDDIDMEAGKLAGDFELLAEVHRGARALLAVAERRVKDDDSVATIVFHVCLDGWVVAARPSFPKTKTPPPVCGDGVEIRYLVRVNTRPPPRAAAGRCSAAVGCSRLTSRRGRYRRDGA